MTLLRYFAWRYLVALGIVIGVLAGILILIETVEQLRRHAGAVGLPRILGLAILKSSEAFYDVLPLVGLIAAVVLFVGLAKSSELVVTRASGRSAVRALGGPVLAAVTFGIVAVAVLNPLAVTARRAYLAQLAVLNGAPADNVAVLSAEGLWLRQATQAGQMVIRATSARRDGTELYAVGFMDFDPQGRPLRRIEAPTARLDQGVWILQDAKLWHFGAENPEAVAQWHASLMLTTDLTAQNIRDSLGTSDDVSVWDLPQFIAALDRAGFSSRPFTMQFHALLAMPAMMMAMVLLAAAFTLRASRGGGTGTRVMAALLAGFGTFFLARFGTVMGETGRLPVLLAAWSPALVSGFLALALLLHREDG